MEQPFQVQCIGTKFTQPVKVRDRCMRGLWDSTHFPLPVWGGGVLMPHCQSWERPKSQKNTSAPAPNVVTSPTLSEKIPFSARRWTALLLFVRLSVCPSHWWSKRTRVTSSTHFYWRKTVLRMTRAEPCRRESTARFGHGVELLTVNKLHYSLSRLQPFYLKVSCFSIVLQ